MDRSIAQVVEGLRDLAHVPALGRLFLALFTDSRVPLWLKICAAAGAVYVISPIDVIPDSVTGIGYLDDIIMVVLILQTFIEMSPDEVVLEHCHRLGIDPAAVHVNVAQAVSTSIAAVLPFVDGKGEGKTTANAARYSVNGNDDDTDQPAPAASTVSDSSRLHRYSAYSTQQG